MVLIISNEDDFSTNIVIDWLCYKNTSFIRINDTDKLKVKNFRLNDNEINFTVFNDNISFDFSSIHSIWYRRGMIDLSIDSLKNKVGDDSVNEISNHLMGEYIHFNYGLLNMLYSKFTINKSYDNNTNKISNLFFASQVGLKIPSTIISDNKNEVKKFFNSEKDVITKAIFYGSFESNGQVSVYTNKVEKKTIDKISDSFWFSKLQSNLEKAYELRIFYLHKEFYASAIFSQNDKKTETDFRKYNYENPNRTPPYNLPEDIKIKIIAFMNKINMNCGSIDMVYTIENEYVFLEVNPIGQFQQVSLPCNYNLEEKIAQTLIDGR